MGDYNSQDLPATLRQKLIIRHMTGRDCMDDGSLTRGKAGRQIRDLLKGKALQRKGGK